MKAKILAVDDDKSVLDAFARKFRKHYDISCAFSAKEGLDLLSQEGPFAVIVSDWKMPGMDGVQFLGEAKRRAPDAARIMLTGHGCRHLAEDAVGEGHLFRFLTKPCLPVDLFAAIETGVAHYFDGKSLCVDA